MPRFRARPALALAACGLSLAVVSGCAAPTRAYTPSAASARDSLDRALAAWQKGGTIGELATNSPQIHVVDHQWQAGYALQGYEIAEEKLGVGGAERRLVVRLSLKKPAREQRVEYIAIGRDPIWLFRDDDYAKAGDMGYDSRPSRVGRRK